MSMALSEAEEETNFMEARNLREWWESVYRLRHGRKFSSREISKPQTGKKYLQHIYQAKDLYFKYLMNNYNSIIKRQTIQLILVDKSLKQAHHTVCVCVCVDISTHKCSHEKVFDIIIYE